MEQPSEIPDANSQERGYRETSLLRREIQGLYFAKKQYIPCPLPINVAAANATDSTGTSPT